MRFSSEKKTQTSGLILMLILVWGISSGQGMGCLRFRHLGHCSSPNMLTLISGEAVS